MPILSVCIPTYNRHDFLMKNLLYFKNHNSSDIEIIISDNASSDGTYEDVLNFINGNCLSNFRYFRNTENIGPDANFKKALSYSNGTFSYLLGDDDFLKDDFLDIVVPFLVRNQYVSFVSLASQKMLKKSNDGNLSKTFCNDQLEQFLVDVGPNITFMSLMIFNKEIMKKVLSEDFHYEKNLFQSFLVVSTINHQAMSNFCILYYCPFVYNGKTSASNYNFYDVFINKVISLYSYALPNKSLHYVYFLYGKSFMKFLLKFTIVLKAINVDLKIDKKTFNVLKHFVSFWVLLFPIYLVPNKVFSVLYRVYKRA